MTGQSMKSIFEGKIIEKRYRLKNFVREGNFGAVFRGHLEIFDEPVRDVAVKISKQTGLNKKNAKNIFAEAIMLARIYDKIRDNQAKTYIVPVYDMGILEEYDNRGFIVMGLISGTGSTDSKYIPPTSLENEIKIWKKGMAPGQALHFFKQICMGMSAVHQQKVIHRDLKPDNILLTATGEIRIVDFGLAAGINDVGYVGGAAGTHRYMAPETAIRELSTPQSDVYSLGIILYEMLTGKYPFEDLVPPVGMSEEERNKWVQNRKREVIIDPPSRYNREIGEWIDALTALCLRNDRESRPKDAGELLEMIKQGEKHPRIREMIAGIVGEQVIIDEAEENGLINRIGSWFKGVTGKQNLLEASLQLEKAVDSHRGTPDELWFENMTKLIFCYIGMKEKSPADILKRLDVLDCHIKSGRFLLSFNERAKFYMKLSEAMKKKRGMKMTAYKYCKLAEEAKKKSKNYRG